MLLRLEKKIQLQFYVLKNNKFANSTSLTKYNIIISSNWIISAKKKRHNVFKILSELPP